MTIHDIIQIYMETMDGVLEILEMELTEGIDLALRLILMFVSMFLRSTTGVFKSLCIAVGMNTA